MSLKFFADDASEDLGVPPVLDGPSVNKDGRGAVDPGLAGGLDIFLNNGLGTAVAEVLSDNSLSLPFKRLGIPDEFPHGVGSQEYFLDRYQLTPDKIATTVKKLLHK